MRFSHTLSTCKRYVSVSIIVLAMTLFLAGCPSPNDPAPNNGSPTVSITVDRKSISESAGSAMVTLTRSQDEVRADLTVQLSIEGTATIDEDYELSGVTTTTSDETVTATVTIPRDTTTVTFTITAVNDGAPDNGEEVVITIKESGDYTIGDPSTATLTIVDPAPSDAPVVSISTSDTSNAVNEGGTITVTIGSNQPVTDNLEVSLTIGGDATIDEDYALPGVTTNTLDNTVTATVTINDGEKSATITIPVHDDNDHEEDETVVMSIDPSSNYHINNGEESATVTILNDDLPTVGFRTTSQTLQEGDDEGVTVIVERSTDKVLAPLKVQLSFAGSTANEGEDYTGLTTTASFREGSDEVTITLTAEDDVIREATETVVITIIDESPSTYRSKEGEETVTVTITDDDLPTVSIAVGSVSISESSADGEVEVTEVTLTRSNDEVRGSLTVQLDIKGNAENGKDYETLSNTVTFNDGEDTATITLTAVNDDIPEGEETVVITIIEMPGAYTVGGSRTATVTITDDDLPIVGFRTASQRLDEGDGESVTVTVGRSNDEALLPLEVQLSFAGNATEGVDFEPITTPITIPRTKASVDFTLQLRDDDDVEANEEVIITISEMPNAYTINKDNNEVIITIVNDDTSVDDIDGDTIENSEDVDDDNDGLIEIHNLDMLRNVHFNLAGTSYDDEEDDSAGNEGDTNGAPTSPTEHCNTPVNEVFLCGYELTGNLDFIDAGSYDADTINTDWRPDGEGNSNDATNEGFPGIGPKTGSSGGFTGIFEGNGHSISNLYMRNTTNTTTDDYRTGLFRLTSSGAKIRNLGMINVSLYGGDGLYDQVGGLVGANLGTITASYATGTVDGRDGSNDLVGGLVGWNSNGTITASYASGTVDGGAGNIDLVGGLVGQNSGDITASYASGTVDGGAGNDFVGGLVGQNSGDITASYATGTVDGGAGNRDRVGGLVGNSNGPITASYGFGTTVGSGGSDGTQKPTLSDGTSITMASQLSQPGSTASKTTAPAVSSWNNADSNTLGAWDFGDTSQNPALKYADYDDSGNTYSCDLFPACGDLLPGQNR